MMNAADAPNGPLLAFGPGGIFLGCITESAHPGAQIGVILFGFGVSECRIARRLSTLGFVVMQIRLVSNYDDVQHRVRFYDDFGIWAFVQAIDELNSRRGIQRVILMGNCAEANLCFNTALVEPRVVGLIMTNLYVNEMLTVVDECRRNIFSLGAWRRLLTGDSSARVLKAFLLSRMRGASDQSLAAQSCYKKDIVLPLDFDRKLVSLVSERGVRALILFFYTEIGLRYFRKTYGETLSKLVAAGSLQFEVMLKDLHEFSTDDEAARQLSEIVATWSEKLIVTPKPGRMQAQITREDSAIEEAVSHASICERFYAIARAQANQIAIRDDGRSLTYAELATESRRVAGAIAATAVDHGPVAVLLDSDARWPAAIMGVWAAGRVCVPLDADHPIERNGRIAAHSGASTVFTTADLVADASAIFPGIVQILDLDDLSGRDFPPPATLPKSHDVACIIYTSGSTGAPKGVFQSHRGLLHDVMEAVNVAAMSQEDRVALFYPPSVIAGLRTMLSALASGATLEMLPPRNLGRRALAGKIKERGITILRSSPTLFRHLAGSLSPGVCFETVRAVALGGERVDWSDYDLFRRACPARAELYVHLGATECWTLHTEWRVDPSVRASVSQLPVGRVIPGKRVDIVDERGKSVAEGAVGEAVVTSRYIALGYWRDSDLTAEFFTVDPTDPLRRSYRTGDFVRQRPDGLVEFVGRKDQQIKLHGYRIEIQEIESALKACAGVSDAAVVVRKNTAGSPVALAGYVQLEAAACGRSGDDVMAMLSRRVAPYMMPAEIGVLDELPWLPNFKIDRQRLAQIDASRANGQEATERSPLIGALVETFEHVMKVSGVRPSDNILSLGGDSLQALELALEIERRFGVVVPNEAQDPTRSISQWARDISAWRSSEATCGIE
jgi:amino acid adenylation domain-containing protein